MASPGLTLENLNSAFLKKANKDETDMRSLGAVRSVKEITNILKSHDLEFERMFTSAGMGKLPGETKDSPNNDCLIQAFLIATCPNFRKLSQGNKDIFASSFRRRHFLIAFQKTATFENILTNTSKEESIKVISGKRFLSDLHLSALCEIFRIKVLVFEAIGGTYSYNMVGVTDTNTPEDEVYIIHNPDGIHFEPLRKKGVIDGYTIPYALAEEISKGITNTRNSRVGCAFNVGDEVLYKGKKYYVVTRRLKMNSTECNTYGLSENPDHPREIIQLWASRQSGQAERKEIEYSAITVNSKNVSRSS